MSHRALITGVTGFAGGFLAEHLLDCGDAVLGCSADGTWLAGRKPSASVQNSVELFAWDLAEGEAPSDEARRRINDSRPDVIYHLAALSVPEDCGLDEPTPRAVAVNVEGTRRVLALAASLSWPVRVLFISSSLVYAPVDSGSARVDENAPLGPRRGYGKTKLAAEELVLRACRRPPLRGGARGCDAVIARAFQHTGPRQEARMMLPSWARQFAAGGNVRSSDFGRDLPPKGGTTNMKPVEVYTLDAQMDLSDVRDVVRAYRLLAERGRRGEVYNVGRGTECSSGNVFEMLRALADPTRPVVETRPGPRWNPVADITRLVDTTGWKAEISLEKTVADTLHWWQEREAAGRGKVD